MKESSNTYDAIIIGAGIGGLVCGCYLAKAGMKVLICEQHYKPGGYCTSFKRGGFTFDAAAHCFGGYRKDGITRKIFDELNISKKIKITRSNPSNTIITPEYTVSFFSALDKSIDSLQQAFPEERYNLKNFFYYLINPNPSSFARIRSLTFKNLLDKYFTNDKLKFILAAPLLGIGGLPPSLMSSFIGAKLFSEFLLDGGYHPEGGMQALSNALAKRFKEFGGEIKLSCQVKKIKVKDKTVKGILIGNNTLLHSKYVVSNCDARQTFLKLLGHEKIEEDLYKIVKSMVPSISSIILYLGMDNQFKSKLKPGSTICFFPHYNLDMAYKAALKGNIEIYGGYMLYIYKDMPAILAIIPTSYRNKTYWANNKNIFMNTFIDRIEKYLIPNLSKYIIYKEAATPYTLYRYTSNYRGSSFGWAATPSQLALSYFRKPPFPRGLYLTGHWTTFGVGISGVVYVGYETAKMLQKNYLRYKIDI